MLNTSKIHVEYTFRTCVFIFKNFAKKTHPRDIQYIKWLNMHFQHAYWDYCRQCILGMRFLYKISKTERACLGCVCSGYFGRFSESFDILDNWTQKWGILVIFSISHLTCIYYVVHYLSIIWFFILYRWTKLLIQRFYSTKYI